MNRCELSDLPEDQCACRIHAKPDPPHTFGIAARFAARFDSQCENCGNRIHEGDPIARTQDGDYVCSECVS